MKILSIGEIYEQNLIYWFLVAYLYISKAIESLLVAVFKNSKRIPETKRSLGTKSILEGHLEGGGRCHAGGRGEC